MLLERGAAQWLCGRDFQLSKGADGEDRSRVCRTHRSRRFRATDRPLIGAPPPRRPGPRPWWEGRPFLAALILVSMVPLIYPPVPPLVDLLGHMGRYRVQLDLDQSPIFQRYYHFEWALIGNL